jgi:hypothetical protein
LWDFGASGSFKVHSLASPLETLKRYHEEPNKAEEITMIIHEAMEAALSRLRSSKSLPMAWLSEDEDDANEEDANEEDDDDDLMRFHRFELREGSWTLVMVP